MAELAGYFGKLRLPLPKNFSGDPSDWEVWEWNFKSYLAIFQPSNVTKYCACRAERLTCWTLITYETSFTVRGATGVPFQRHQILRLSRIKSHMLNHHIWNVIYSARSKRCHDPTSPNTAPATQKDSHASSSSHMKRHLQCAEQQASPSNITKYTAPATQNCIAKFLRKSLRTDDNVISNAGLIRLWSEHDPTMIRAWNRRSATRLATELTFRAHHEHFWL